MTRVANNKLNFIDIFSGAGGLSCGLEKAGHKCVLGVDYDQHAMNTFAANHKHAQVYCGDIRELSTKKLKELTGHQDIHAVVGGPPCQGFSTAGAGNPDDDRNALFLEFVRVVKVTKPYFIVMENVTGLLAKKNENTLKKIFMRFKRLGYHMEAKVLSAHHYGAPEKRRRTIFIGSRLGNKSIIFPQMTHEDEVSGRLKPTVTVGDVIYELADKKGIINNHDLPAAKMKSKVDERRLARIPEGKGIRYQRDEDKYFTPSLKLGVDWQNLRENRFRQTKYQRLDRQKASPTIMTNRHSYYHPVENRYLTAREAAKIQSFPNNFVFTGPLSAQWRQIGNAVPPLLGQAIGKTLKKMLQQSNEVPNDKDKGKTTKAKKTSAIENLRSNAFVYRKKTSTQAEARS